MNDRPMIKSGYLVVVNYEDKVFNMTVIPNSSGGLGLCCPGHQWFPLEALEDDGREVLKVYGCTYNCGLLENSTKDRELLWESSELGLKNGVEVEIYDCSHSPWVNGMRGVIAYEDKDGWFVVKFGKQFENQFSLHDMNGTLSERLYYVFHPDSLKVVKRP